MSTLLVGFRKDLVDVTGSLRLLPNEAGALDIVVYPNNILPEKSSYLVFRTKAYQDEIKPHLEEFRTKPLKMMSRDLSWLRVDAPAQELLGLLEKIPNIRVMR